MFSLISFFYLYRFRNIMFPRNAFSRCNDEIPYLYKDSSYFKKSQRKRDISFRSLIDFSTQATSIVPKTKSHTGTYLIQVLCLCLFLCMISEPITYGPTFCRLAEPSPWSVCMYVLFCMPVALR